MSTLFFAGLCRIKCIRWSGVLSSIILLALMLTGCNDASNPPIGPSAESDSESNDPLAFEPPVIRSKPVVSSKEGGPRRDSGEAPEGQESSVQSGDVADAGNTTEDPTPAYPPRTLGDLIKGDDQPFQQTRMEIDEERVTANGITLVKGKHLHLYSDLRNLALLRELVSVFDAAVPLWCGLFDVEPSRVEQWYVTGFLVQDAARMNQAGLFPADLPPFPNGYSRGLEFWFYDQPSAFYRRYLMLHEGTHAFMQQMLGGRGAPWYSEGMAEYLSVHTWDENRLELKQSVNNREDAPLWGRVKLVQNEFGAEKILMPEDIMLMEDEQFLRNEAYGWAWALCHFLDRHPSYHSAFVELEANVKDRSPRFANPLLERLKDDWSQVREEWQVFIAEVDYGYDIARMAIDYVPVVDLDDEAHEFAVQADRGWQSTGLRLQPGERVEISAAGRFLVKSGTEEWPAEPSGITIDYYQGRPLGQLFAAVRQDDDSLTSLTPLLAPVAVGDRQIVLSERGGVLFLRLNDAPNSLADNQGETQVTIQRSK